MDPDWQYRLALERGDSLRAKAARERLARLALQPERNGRTSFRTLVGGLLIRAGRALSGDRSSGNAMTSRIVARGSLDERRHPTGPIPDNGTWVVVGGGSTQARGQAHDLRRARPARVPGRHLAARVAVFGDHKPTDTLVGVETLAEPGYLIEIEAIAVLD